MLTTRARATKIAWSLAIVLASASAGILVDWQAPGIARYTRDWLMRARGPLPVPEDIAIVAIDEISMVRFGRFPWSRQVIARAIDALSAARPKVIALDVLITDPTTQEDDDDLARSIGRAGNVVVAAQLTDSPVHGGPSRWLQPLPAIERAAQAGTSTRRPNWMARAR
jgi:CHASE2 domain-containing sensor protein